MKQLRFSLYKIALLVLSLPLAQRADAASAYWDINGTTPGAGGPSPNGSWEDPNWTTDSTGSSATTTWTDGGFPIFAAGSDASAPFVVTVSANHTIAGMQMLSPCTNVVINGSGILSIADGQQGFFPNGSSLGGSGLWINAVLGGTGGLINQNASYLYLYGNNTYSGGTTFAANHIVYYNNNNSFGTGPITNNATGGLSILTTNSLALSPNLPNDFWINNAGAPFNFGGGNTICSGHFYLQSALQLKNNGGTATVLTISGPISETNGSFGLSLLCPNSGKIVLSGPNTYSGKTSIATLAGAGTTTVSVSSLNSVNGGTPLLDSSSFGRPTTVGNGTIDLGYTTFGATLIYTGSGETSDRVINLSGSTGAAALEADGTGPLVLSSDFTATAATEGNKTLTLQGSSTAANAINGAIVDPSGFKTSLTKAQAGTWVLAGANTYSGNTTVSAGTLRQGAANVIPYGTGKGNFASSAGAVFDLNGFDCQLNGFGTSQGAIDNRSGSGTYTLTLGNADATGTHNGVIQNTSGTIQVTKVGTATITLDGASTYSGITTLSSGTLAITNDSGLGAAPAVFVANQLVLDTANNNGATAYSLRVQNNNFTLAATRGIYVTANGGAINVQNGIRVIVSGVISGPGAFWACPNDSAGYGVIQMAANNTYLGPTYVGAGTLQLGINNAIPVGSPLTIGWSHQGAATNTIFDLNGLNQTIGPLASNPGFGPNTHISIPLIKLTGALTIFQTSDTAYDGTSRGDGGSLTLDASSTGTLTLSRTNLYTGPTVINGGKLEVAADNGLASTSVSVASGATLLLDSPTALSASADLIVASGTPTVNLNFSGTNTIHFLSLNGGATYVAPGVWSSPSAAPAAPNTDSRFTGGGYLNVGATPGTLSTTNTILSITNNGNATFTLKMLGTPGASYYLVATNAVAVPFATWPALSGSTNTAPGPSGQWSFTVSNAAPAYYRSIAVNPAH